MEKIVTPKRIREAFGIESRRLTYLIERGHVVADVQDLGERGLVRLFSPREAVKVGVVEFFCGHGMTLHRAAKLAEVAVTAPCMTHKTRKHLQGEPKLEITVMNGQLALLILAFPTTDPGHEEALEYVFNLDHSKVDLESVFQTDVEKMESSCTYYITHILQRLTGKLGLTVDDINEPKVWPLSAVILSKESDLLVLKFKDN